MVELPQTVARMEVNEIRCYYNFAKLNINF
jgi:hypothetical protein